MSHIIWTFVIINLYKSLKGGAIERKKHVQYKEAYQNFMISRSGSVQPDDDISVCNTCASPVKNTKVKSHKYSRRKWHISLYTLFLISVSQK